MPETKEPNRWWTDHCRSLDLNFVPDKPIDQQVTEQLSDFLSGVAPRIKHLPVRLRISLVQPDPTFCFFSAFWSYDA